MKKAFLVSIILLSMCITACASQDAEIGNTTQESKSEFESQKEDKSFEESPEEPKADTKAETAIEQQVIFDQDGIIITATGIDFNSSFMGPEIKLLIENNTEKNLTVQARNVSVN